jgi:DNA invertase Pin-like site-specific DNA recombinase
MSANELIQPGHLARKAVIYVRQSTEQQVTSHLESQRLQRAMKDRALLLGWPESQIQTVEIDTGHSGQSIAGRDGYKRLLAEIGEGLVGIVLSYESARLTRNCGDWYRLLDWCVLNDCLIGDRDGVYDASNSNGRLLLGMKGMLSEFELHTLRNRLVAGMINKAKRGELVQNLPAGFTRLEDGRVVKDPDQAIQRAIEVVFSSFSEAKSACRVARKLREGRLLLPRRYRNRETVWRQPTASRVTSILRNPTYAGAFAFGRMHNVRRPGADGTRVARQRVNRPEWPVLLKESFSGYVNWDEYERIQEILKDNRAEYERKLTRGIAREGEALLQGIAYCGGCGRKMTVRYGRDGRYTCAHDHREAGARVCQSLLAGPIDRAVVAAFLEALSPAELDIYDETLERHLGKADEIRAAEDRQIERLRYETELAHRQYHRVDPDNRLVAGELERRWELALRALKEAELRREEARVKSRSTLEKKLPEELKAALRDLGEELPRLWETDVMKPRHKKGLLRCLIDKAVMQRESSNTDQVRLRIVWRGGLDSTLLVPIEVGSMTSVRRFEEMERRILELERKGLTDEAIAATLTEEGFRSPRKLTVLPATVRVLRVRKGRTHRYRKSRDKRVEGYLTVPQVAKALGVRNEWLYHRIKTGKIDSKLDPELGLYLIPDTPEALHKIRRVKEDA